MANEFNLLRFDTTTGTIQYFEGASWYSVTFGNFAAGTITGSLTGHASLDLPLTGGALTGALTFTGTTFAMKPPMLNDTQMNALTPAEGMTIYNTTSHALAFYNGSTWKVVATV